MNRRNSRKSKARRHIKLGLADPNRHPASGSARTAKLLSPPPSATARWRAIPLLFEHEAALPAAKGSVGFDSWAGTSIGLRDLDSGHVRRLRFKAGRVTLELVAERRGDVWEFVARAYSGNSVVHGFVLLAGRKRLLSTTDGFYLWSSSTRMRTIRLAAPDRLIEFGGITW